MNYDCRICSIINFRSLFLDVGNVKTEADQLIHSFQESESYYGNMNGLTKREYFAVMALQGILAGVSGVEALASVHSSNWVTGAVEAADALIEALNKEEKP